MMVLGDAMNKPLKQTLFWAPRIAGILFILFISLFALDIFSMQLGFWGTILGLFMHLNTSILLTIALVLAWKWEWVGTAAFGGWSVWYVINAGSLDWSVYVILAGIPAVIGLLFLAGWIKRKEIRG